MRSCGGSLKRSGKLTEISRLEFLSYGRHFDTALGSFLSKQHNRYRFANDILEFKGGWSELETKLAIFLAGR